MGLPDAAGAGESCPTGRAVLRSFWIGIASGVRCVYMVPVPLRGEGASVGRRHWCGRHSVAEYHSGMSPWTSSGVAYKLLSGGGCFISVIKGRVKHFFSFLRKEERGLLPRSKRRLRSEAIAVLADHSLSGLGHLAPGPSLRRPKCKVQCQDPPGRVWSRPAVNIAGRHRLHPALVVCSQDP